MWAEYSIEKLKPLRDCRRFDDNRGNRFYWFMENDEPVIASGVTSVFGIVSVERKAIDTWKENNDDWRDLLKASSDYGTALHTQYGRLMLNMGVDKDLLTEMQKVASDNGASYDMPRKDILSFLKFKEDTQLEPLIIEGVLVWMDDSGEYLAMTIDLLARVTTTHKVKKEVEDGIYQRGDKKGQVKTRTVVEEIKDVKTVLIDFKSNFFEKERKSFYEAHKMQLMAAMLAVKQNFDVDVDVVYNYSGNAWRTEPSYTLYAHTIEAKDWDIFNAYWNLAKTKGLNKPEGKILLTGDFKDSNDYQYIDYPTFVRDVLSKESESPAKEESVLETIFTGE